MKKYIFILSFLVVGFSSCKKDEVAGGTAVQDMSGEWWVQVEERVTQPNGDVTIKTPFGPYYSLSSYNTADNSSTVMWLDDSQSFYGLKAKVNVDVNNKTFSATAADELYFEVTVDIKNGQVIKNGAIGAVSKAVTDSIAFDAVFSDSPKSLFRYRGYHRTKFPGDDH
ncbi:lipid-binding protein [Pedobacter ginsengisoli]|uniref:lipid-binding protein n=1 Tax=Pedobacter ginsengisoli TaxID=363852 RepID=UPI00254BD964|nr:lipid-binding protein [Pedobacter ginsengisoli]